MMGIFIDNVARHLIEMNWEGPAMFAIIVLAVFAMFRQWHIVLLTLLTIVLGWGFEDLMILNIETNRDVISVPLMVYSVGGGFVIILSILAFFRMAVK